MKRKLLCLLLAACLLLALAACGRKPDSDDGQGAEEEDSWKIGIVSGTVSQEEETFRAAENMVAEYGADRIVHITYPDNFTTETETLISNVVGLAADPDVKAIVFVQAVPGAAAAIGKVRETRPEILFVCGVPGDDPGVIAAQSDIVLNSDEIAMGVTIIEQAHALGAKTFVHYSFPRHMSYATIAARYQLLQQTCEQYGIEFVAETAPDPTGDSGLSGAQQFIVEDVPRKVSEYGADTAFFNTNCGMQEPLITQVIKHGAIFPQQCCPSPFHGYPSALGIDVKGHEGDVQYMLDQITEKVASGGNSGRMSTWGFSINMLELEAGVRYAEAFIKGETNGRVDSALLTRIIQDIAGGADKATVSTYVEKYTETDADGNEVEKENAYDNYFMVMGDYYTF
ncbi:MAG: DUF3798 domain-containing protein [Clostridiales bacterium]|nr:DUF3798 domain-containing protein [Clostridiales bacterium]